MSDFSKDQAETRAKIQKSAVISGVIVGGIAGLLALWILGGQGAVVRFGGAVVLGLGVGFAVFRASFKSGSKAAQCEKCGATFSRTRTDRAETLISSTPKDKQEEQPDQSVKVTSWIEETFDVLDTYTCAKCADTSTKTYQTTRRRDEETVVQPFVSAKGGQSRKSAAAGDGPSGEATAERPKGRKGSNR